MKSILDAGIVKPDQGFLLVDQTSTYRAKKNMHHRFLFKEPSEEYTIVKNVKYERKMVVVSNNLLLSKEELVTSLELKLLRIIVSQYNDFDREGNQEAGRFVFRASVKDLSEKIFQTKAVKRKSAYEEIEKAAANLLNYKSFILQQSNWKGINWVKSAEYANGMIEIHLNEELLPFILNLSDGNFTQYKLDSILKFKNKYAIRIYEALKAKIGKRKILREGFKNGETVAVKIRVDEFRRITFTENIYSKFNDIKVRCIKPVVQEFLTSDESDIGIQDVTYERKTKAVSAIIFHVFNKMASEKTSKARQLLDNEDIFDEHKAVSADYIGSIFDRFHIECDGSALNDLADLYLSVGADTDIFNQDFKAAYANADFNAVKYLKKSAVNRLSEQSKTKNAKKENLEALVKKWNTFCEKTAAEPNPLHQCLFPTETEFKNFAALLNKGITVKDLEKGMTAAKKATYFRSELGGTFGVYLKRFEKIVNGDYTKMAKKSGKDLDVYRLSDEDRRAYERKAEEDEAWFENIEETRE